MSFGANHESVFEWRHLHECGYNDICFVWIGLLDMLPHLLDCSTKVEGEKVISFHFWMSILNCVWFQDNTVVPAAANNLSGTTKRLLIDDGSGVLVYEDDIVSKEVKSAARAPFADPTFLHGIGTTFLERYAKNSSQKLGNFVHF